jgi:hypothetical protein
VVDPDDLFCAAMVFQHGADANGRWVLHEVDPTTSDEERARWDVPPLAEALRRADQMTCDPGPSPLRDDRHRTGSDLDKR